MEYMVTGSDGAEYGPVQAGTLRVWLKQGRISPGSALRDFNTGQQLKVADIPGMVDPPQLNAPYYRAMPGAMPGVRPVNVSHYDDNSDMGQFWRAIIYATISIILFFVAGRITIIFSGYSLYHAITVTRDGNRYGWIAIVLASIAVLLALLGIVLVAASPRYPIGQ